MSSGQLEKILLSGIKVCFYLALFAPLILSAAFFFPAIFPKTVYFRLLIELAFIFYIPLALADERFRPRRHVVYWAIVFFAAMVFITAFTGVDWHYSFWGNYERMDGIFSWLHYWILIFMMSCVLRAKTDWRKLFTAALAAAMLVTGYGFLQYAGVENLGPLKIYESGMGRLQGSIANPGFLAAYLLFNLALALLLAVDKTAAAGQRLFGGLALIWLMVAFSLTDVRGAFLGFVVGLIFFGLGYLFWQGNQGGRRKLALSLFLAFLFIVSLFVVFRKADFVINNQIVGRFFNTSLTDSTVRSRLISWRRVLPSVKDNFWLGVGPQKFDYVFNKYFDPKFYTVIGGESWWDRAHNMPLEVLITMGMAGLASYLLVGLALLRTLWLIGQKHKSTRTEMLILASLFIAYFIQNLFIFDSINTYIMLAVVMAYVISRSFEMEAAPSLVRFDALLDKLKRFKLPALRRIWLSLIIIFLLLAPVAYAGNIKLLEHNRLFLKALSLQGQLSLPAMVDSYREIFTLSDFDQREAAIKLGFWLGQYVLAKPMTESDFESSYRFLILNMEKARRQNPKDVRLLLSYGNVLNIYGELAARISQGRSEPILAKAAEIFQTAIALGAGRQQVYFSLANTYIIGGNAKKGIEVLQSTAKLNEDNAITYWLLAFAYMQAGDKDKAIAAANQAVEKNYIFNQEQEADTIAGLYVDKKDYEGLLRLYKRVFEVFHTGRSQAHLAAVYAQMGRQAEALAAAKEVIKLDPSLQGDVEAFIKDVESGRKKDFLK